MIFSECVQGRRSVRKFKLDGISDAALKEVVQADAYTPSWKNSQATRYIAVSDEGLKSVLAEECVMDFVPNQKTIQNAPMLILGTTVSPRSSFECDGTPCTSKGTHWESFDAGIATQTLCLAVYEQGLGTVVFGIFDEEKVIRAAGVPEGQKVSAMVASAIPTKSQCCPNVRALMTC